MRESKFTSELSKSFRRHGCFTFKIPDAPISKETTMYTRFTPGKPFDLVVASRGRIVPVETKQLRKWKGFSIREMRPAQVKGLGKLIDTGNPAFVFLNIRIEPNIKKGTPRENRLIVFDWAWLRVRLADKPLTIKELKAWPHTTGSKGLFDLTQFLDRLVLEDEF